MADVLVVVFALIGAVVLAVWSRASSEARPSLRDLADTRIVPAQHPSDRSARSSRGRVVRGEPHETDIVHISNILGHGPLGERDD